MPSRQSPRQHIVTCLLKVHGRVCPSCLQHHEAAAAAAAAPDPAPVAAAPAAPAAAAAAAADPAPAAADDDPAPASAAPAVAAPVAAPVSFQPPPLLQHLILWSAPLVYLRLPPFPLDVGVARQQSTAMTHA